MSEVIVFQVGDVHRGRSEIAKLRVTGKAGSIGMLLGERWGFLLALAASVPFWYTAITIFIWDRDLGFRQNTFTYRVVVWGIWPVFGIL